jgi:hypothetical protein
MSISSAFLRSLLLTSLLSFAAPTFLLGSAIASLTVIGYVPFLGSIGQFGVDQLWQFLMTFGSGNAFHGILVIGCTCSLVGALFDACTFYRYQNLRGD